MSRKSKLAGTNTLSSLARIGDQGIQKEPGERADLLAVRLAEAQRISGLSRSDLYRRASRGEIVFLKAGARILVDMKSLRAVLAGLPRAEIHIAA